MTNTIVRYKHLESLLRELMALEGKTKEQEELLLELLEIREVSQFVLTEMSFNPPKDTCPCCGRKK